MNAKARIKRSLERFNALHSAEIDLGLDRMRDLLHRMGNPHLKLPPVIHVAGTNGKGSTIAMLGAMAQAAGLATHIHTSPHLITLNERYVIAGTTISDLALADLLENVERINGGQIATQFELLMTAAFVAFSRTPADLVLMEVGLGGEFDASNVIENPALCLLTPIAHDHADYLGEDMAGIARAKAGIIKPGATVLSAAQNDLARDIIVQTCARNRASLRMQGEDFHARVENDRLIYEDERQLLDLPLPGLAGIHQVQNAGLTVAAALKLDLDDEAIAKGLESVRWPGRMQTFYPDNGAQIIVDGAHNPHAAKALADSIAHLQHRDPRPLIIIAGLQQTKDAPRFFAAFKGLKPEVICVPVPGAPHPMTPEAMQRAAQGVGLRANTATDIHTALNNAIRKEKEPHILVCGSLYLAGTILAQIGKF